jgi:hypothetical protein
MRFGALTAMSVEITSFCDAVVRSLVDKFLPISHSRWHGIPEDHYRNITITSINGTQRFNTADAEAQN